MMPSEYNLGLQSYLVTSGCIGNIKVVTKNVKKQIKKIGPLDMFLYTDGYQKYVKVSNPNGTGTRWVIKQVENWFNNRRAALKTTQEV